MRVMPRAQTTSSSRCALCGANRKLEQSHIIPQFVYRWAKSTAGGKEIPAGPTRPMLCGGCEDLFSSYESEFARHVFHPFATRATRSAKYGAWLRKFAASVCWRILEVSVTENRLDHFNGRWMPELAACRETWQRYLVGQRPDVGGHHLHLVLGAPGVEQARFHSAVEGQVSCGEQAAFVYAKLGPIFIIGVVADPAVQLGRGTRINAEGKLKTGAVVIADQLLDALHARTRLG